MNWKKGISQWANHSIHFVLFTNFIDEFDELSDHNRKKLVLPSRFAFQENFLISLGHLSYCVRSVCVRVPAWCERLLCTSMYTRVCVSNVTKWIRSLLKPSLIDVLKSIYNS